MSFLNCIWEHTLSILHFLCQRGLWCQHHSWGCLGCEHPCQKGQHCGYTSLLPLFHHLHEVQSTYLQIYRYMDLSHILVCCGKDPLLGSRCPTCWNSKVWEVENSYHSGVDVDVTALTIYI